MEASQPLVHCLLIALGAAGHVPLLDITFPVPHSLWLTFHNLLQVSLPLLLA